MCQQYNLKLLVVDALSRIHESDENSAKEFGKVLANLDRLRWQTGCAILLIHHDRKGHSNGQDGGMDAMRGSSRLASDAQLLMHLVKQQGRLKLSFEKTNLGVTPEPIWFRQDGDGTWKMTNAPASQSATANEHRGQVLTLIQHAGAGGITKQEIVVSTEYSESTVERYLRDLKQQGSIQQQGHGNAVRMSVLPLAHHNGRKRRASSA